MLTPITFDREKIFACTLTSINVTYILGFTYMITVVC